MARGHPVDALGRALPHPGWPDDRQAPGELELVRRFCNSTNRENGAERFTHPTTLDAWLVTEGQPVAHATNSDLARVIAVRDTLHLLVVANATGNGDPDAWRHLGDLLSTSRVGFASDDTSLTAVPAGRGVDAFLARIGLAVAAATADGTWPRLKACRNCHWVVFDPSKNRSSRWCSMSACGGRHNAREYRRRQSAPPR
jgi:predicted RNA-binding Zn ribbon-like protein